MFLDMKTLKDEWYIAIKAYKFTVSEIWRDIIIYCASALSRHIESTNSMVTLCGAIFPLPGV